MSSDHTRHALQQQQLAAAASATGQSRYMPTPSAPVVIPNQAIEVTAPLIASLSESTILPKGTSLLFPFVVAKDTPITRIACHTKTFSYPLSTTARIHMALYNNIAPDVPGTKFIDTGPIPTITVAAPPVTAPAAVTLLKDTIYWVGLLYTDTDPSSGDVRYYGPSGTEVPLIMARSPALVAIRGWRGSTGLAALPDNPALVTALSVGTGRIARFYLLRD